MGPEEERTPQRAGSAVKQQGGGPTSSSLARIWREAHSPASPPPRKTLWQVQDSGARAERAERASEADRSQRLDGVDLGFPRAMPGPVPPAAPHQPVEWGVVGGEQVKGGVAPGVSVVQLKAELDSKERQLGSLRAEHSALLQAHRGRIAEITAMNENTMDASQQTMRTLREDLAAKQEQVRQLQTLLEQSAPAQQRLEEQLSAAQQLVRGSLLQHERYEATTEQQGREIVHLRKDKERLERELQRLQREQADQLSYGTVSAGAGTLQEVVDQERRRFKKALADERQRAAELLERERALWEGQAKHARTEADRQAARAMTDAATRGREQDVLERDNSHLRTEVQRLRGAVEAEKRIAAAKFEEMRGKLESMEELVKLADRKSVV